MRKLFATLAVGAFMLVGGSATAAPVQVQAQVELALGDFGFNLTSSGTVSVVGTGSISLGGVTGSQIVIPAGLASVPAAVTVPVPGNTLITSVILQPGLGNAAGTFSVGGATDVCAGGSAAPGTACVSGGGAGGLMQIVGNITAVALGINIPVPVGSLNIGIGGAFDVDVPSGLGNIDLIGDAGQWTTQVATVATPGGNTLAATGTASGSAISFVSPAFVQILALGGAVNLPLPAIASLTLTAVPEPGTLLLLGTGVAGLALVGRSRRK